MKLDDANFGAETNYPNEILPVDETRQVWRATEEVCYGWVVNDIFGTWLEISKRASFFSDTLLSYQHSQGSPLVQAELFAEEDNQHFKGCTLPGSQPN